RRQGPAHSLERVPLGAALVRVGGAGEGLQGGRHEAGGGAVHIALEPPLRVVERGREVREALDEALVEQGAGERQGRGGAQGAGALHVAVLDLLGGGGGGGQERAQRPGAVVVPRVP